MANRIRELRKSQGLTLAEVAKKIGVSESTMQRYEAEKITKIKYETMGALADLFNVSPEYLMGWSDISDRNSQCFQKICKSIESNDKKFMNVIIDYYSMPEDNKEKFYEFWELFKKMKS